MTRETHARMVAVATGLLVVAGVFLFASLRAQEPAAPRDTVDPQAWAQRFPLHYEATMKTRLDYGRTPFGGSGKHDKLKSNPFRQRAYAGHAFALEHNTPRGHYYTQIDQRDSRRTREREQPAACIHCHAAEGPKLIEQLGWDEFHRHTYDDLKDQVHHGTSCADCHAPKTMRLRVTRPAFIQGMQQRGIDVGKASREQLRTYVCAQCHVEYYVRASDRGLVLPWQRGWKLEEIEAYYDALDFSDWKHAETGAPLLKMQHADFELYSTGTHARRGVSCADCHMPRTHEGGMTITDHWIRSPLVNITNACLTCHKRTEAEMKERAVTVQERTVELRGVTEQGLSDLMDAIVAAQADGVSPERLDAARKFHRRAQLRWDYIDSDNSTGFHSPHEAARLLHHALNFAREGERALRENPPRPEP